MTDSSMNAVNIQYCGSYDLVNISDKYNKLNL